MSDSNQSQLDLVVGLEAACEHLRQPSVLPMAEWLFDWQIALCVFLALHESDPDASETFRAHFGPGQNEEMDVPFLQFCCHSPAPPEVFEMVLSLCPHHLDVETSCMGDVQNGVRKHFALGEFIILSPSMCGCYEPTCGSQTCDFKPELLAVLIRNVPDAICSIEESPMPNRLRQSMSDICCSAIGDPDVAEQVVPALEEAHGKETLKSWLPQGEEADVCSDEAEEHPFHAISRLAKWCRAVQAKLTFASDHPGRANKVTATFDDKSETLEISSTFSVERGDPCFSLEAVLGGICEMSVPLVSCDFEGDILDDENRDSVPTLDQFAMDRRAIADPQEIGVVAWVADPAHIVAFAESLATGRPKATLILCLDEMSQNDMERWNAGLSSLASIKNLSHLCLEMQPKSQFFPAEGVGEFLTCTKTAKMLQTQNHPLQTLEQLAQGIAHNKSLCDLCVCQGSDIVLDHEPLTSVLKTSNSTLVCYEDDDSDRWPIVDNACRMNEAGRFRLLKQDANKETVIEVLQKVASCHNDLNILCQIRPGLWSS